MTGRVLPNQLPSFQELLEGAAVMTRRLRQRLAEPNAVLYHHPNDRLPASEFTDPLLADKVITYLERHGCLEADDVRQAPSLSVRALAAAHSFDYIAKLDDPEFLLRIFPASLSFARRALAAQLSMTNGTIAAALEAARRGPQGPKQVNLGGGFHRAHPDSGGPFCAYNDIAIAIYALRSVGFEGRVLVLDLDHHVGDGTRSFFAADATVMTCSIHSGDEKPIQAIADLSIDLGTGATPAAFREALDRCLDEGSAFDPAFVFYLAGVDVARDDAIGHWRFDSDEILRRDQRVIARFGELPFVWTLAGGFGQDAWRHVARSLAWLLADFSAPIPSDYDKALDHFRRLSQRLQREDLTGESWQSLSPKDLGRFAGCEEPERLLDYYSIQGIESGLEIYGVLPRARELGYSDFDFEMTKDAIGGTLLRLFGEQHGRHLLIEASLREDRSLLGHRLVQVDWLLMQNPLAKATPKRPLLPGQNHPGLGCLGAIMGMLRMLCERLGYDGLGFTPAHYHVAVLARPYLTYLDPRDEARFRALRAAVEGLSLAEASRRIDDQEILDGADQPAGWDSKPMVLPVSPVMEEELRAAEYESALQEASKSFEFRLITS